MYSFVGTSVIDDSSKATALKTLVYGKSVCYGQLNRQGSVSRDLFQRMGVCNTTVTQTMGQMVLVSSKISVEVIQVQV